MRVAVTGRTGFIGSALCRGLVEDHHQVTVLSRDPAAAQRSLGPGIATTSWSPDQPDQLRTALEGVEAVVNLAGQPIAAQRWSDQQKARIRASRVEGTTALVEAL